MQRIFKIIDLIIKQKQSELSKEEQSELDAWLNDSRHKDLYNNISNEDYTLDYLKKLKTYDYNEAYNDFVSRRKTIKKSSKKYRITIGLVAASIIIMLGITWIFNYQKSATIIKSEDIYIAAGNTKAILTKTSGEVLPLNTGTILFKDTIQRKCNKETNVTPQVKMNDVFIPEKCEFSLVLPDGTKVWLNSDSHLQYSDDFGSTNRMVKLSGEAYFDVQRDTLNPFTIHTQKCGTITVLGTSFNVKDYNSDNIATTTLEKGKVVININNSDYTLSPGQQLKHESKNGTVDVNNVNTGLYTAWRDGLFKFERERLEDIASVLSRWYGVEIQFADVSLKEQLFTGDLARYSDINEHLKMLESTTNVNFKLIGTTLIIDKD